MLLEFSVENYMSFRDKKTLRLEATGISDYKENVFGNGRYNVLNGAAIYGANSSGKTNLVRAMYTMVKVLFEERNSTAELGTTPFNLNPNTEAKPSMFEVVFLLEGTRFRYGFEIDNFKVHKEWLLKAEKIKEEVLFYRENDGIEIQDGFSEGRNLEEKTLDNTLFVALVDRFNGTISKKIIGWFKKFNVITSLNHFRHSYQTYQLLNDPESKDKLNSFFSKLDLGFQSITIKEKELSHDLEKHFENKNKKVIPIEMMESLFTPTTLHKIYNDEHVVIGERLFDMRKMESTGTNKIFNISGIIFRALSLGGVLVIDEIDASLHPLMTLAITKLFNSKEHNPKNAQLIFTTHDTNLLNYGDYRRDQIYFIEKDNAEGSDLYSLVEYKEETLNGVESTIRKDARFEKDYIKGRYGAIPFIGNIDEIIKSWQE